MEGWMKENCVIYACTTATVLGLFCMSHSWHSLWALGLGNRTESLQRRTSNATEKPNRHDGGQGVRL